MNHLINELQSVSVDNKILPEGTDTEASKVCLCLLKLFCTQDMIAVRAVIQNILI